MLRQSESAEQAWVDESSNRSDESAVNGEHLDGKRLIVIAIPRSCVDRQCRLPVCTGGHQTQVATQRAGDCLLYTSDAADE